MACWHSKLRFLKNALLILLLSGPVFTISAFATEAPDIDTMSLDDIVHRMTRTRPPQELIATVVKKADTAPEFKQSLIDALTDGFPEKKNKVINSNTVRALRDLQARQVLPKLKTLWEETERITPYLEFGNFRIQLLLTIAEFLPETERIQFLIKTESDTTEAPLVRFRATILLCASGNPKAIEHVLASYEEAKKQYPLTTRLSPDEQQDYLERRAEQWYRETWDSDKDFLSNYIETGLLLDPADDDTDDDGLIDGNDRNPLCKPQQEELSEDQTIAQFILYLHARYTQLSRSPFTFKLLIAQTYDSWDGSNKPGLFEGMQFTGIEGVVLHMNPEQITRFRGMHEPGTSAIGIHKMLQNEETETKEFYISVQGGPGLYRTYNIIMKRFGDVWLPISWQLDMIT